jgi:heat shock protein HslJ
VGEETLLETTVWALVSGRGIELPDDVAPTITLTDGRAYGTTGCNRYSGGYALDGERIELGAIASTRMACAPPLDALELAFLEALAKIVRWQVEGGMLTLRDEHGGELLRFRPA